MHMCVFYIHCGLPCHEVKQLLGQLKLPFAGCHIACDVTNLLRSSDMETWFLMGPETFLYLPEKVVNKFISLLLVVYIHTWNRMQIYYI